jgi:hypothetical protein
VFVNECNIFSVHIFGVRNGGIWLPEDGKFNCVSCNFCISLQIYRMPRVRNVLRINKLPFAVYAKHGLCLTGRTNSKMRRFFT